MSRKRSGNPGMGRTETYPKGKPDPKFGKRVESRRYIGTELGMIVPPMESLDLPFSDRKIVGYGFNEPFFVNTPGLIQMELQGAPNLYGAPPTDASRGLNELAVQHYCDQLYTQLYMEAARRGHSITNFTLTTPANFVIYINLYMTVWVQLRGLQAIIAGMGINNTLSVAARNCATLLPIIDAYMAELLQYPIPQSLLDAIDEMTGLFWTGTSSTVPILVWTQSTVVDFTSVASLNTMIAGVATTLGQISGITPISDAGNIFRLMGFLYGDQPTVKPRQVHYDEQQYHMLFTQAWGWNNTAGPNFGYGVPNTVNPAGVVAFYVWGDPKTVNPLWATLFRPDFYWGASGVANTGVFPRGVFSMGGITNSNGTTFAFYNGETQVRSEQDSSSAGVVTLGITDPTIDFIWAPIAAFDTSAANSYSTDGRSHSGFTRLYLYASEICDNTIRLYDQWFLGDITARPRS